MATTKWKVENIPNQAGKVIVITGATSGLGKQAARVLASKQAKVVMAVRNVQKAEAVIMEIRKEQSNADLQIMELDLNSLQSVRSFAKAFLRRFDRLDVLINNAGVMACPYALTADKLEIQMGVNHFSHFALTGLLMPLLKSTKNSRVVATSSIAHRQGNIKMDDIHWENRDYKTNSAYSDSKLANLYFAYELNRKSELDPSFPTATAAHPGWTSTELQRHSLMFKVLNPIFSQGVESGVLPTLRAATDPTSKGGEFYGPSGFMELKGSPKVVKSNPISQDVEQARQLWTISEEITGVQY